MIHRERSSALHFLQSFCQVALTKKFLQEIHLKYQFSHIQYTDMNTTDIRQIVF